jgi:hypothetical protein
MEHKRYGTVDAETYRILSFMESDTPVKDRHNPTREEKFRDW